jgi:hypothetical protein
VQRSLFLPDKRQTESLSYTRGVLRIPTSRLCSQSTKGLVRKRRRGSGERKGAGERRRRI